MARANLWTLLIIGTLLVCPRSVSGAADALAAVAITNSRSTPIFVSFTRADQVAGSITWGTDCTPTGSGAQVAPGATCQATVTSTAGSSRFCAALDQ